MASAALIDRAKISAVAACTIVVVLGGAGYTAYKDLLASLPSKDVVDSNTTRIQNVITWDKEEHKRLTDERVASETKQHADDVLFQGQVIRRLEIMEGVERDILSRLPRKMAGW